MDPEELNKLIKKSKGGDTEAFISLYSAVYRPLYKIARFALKSEEAAVSALHRTVKDSFTAIAGSDIKGTGAFIEWIVKILCAKIKQQNRLSSDEPPKQGDTFDMRGELDSLPNMDRLVLTVSTICGTDAEKTAKLCGYTVNTVEVCLNNAEMMIQADYLAKS